MNDKLRNALLLVCVVIVLLIIIDMIFNFSGIRVENFSPGSSYASGSGSGGSGSNQQLENNDLDETNIKSIVSKKDGRIFNVRFDDNFTKSGLKLGKITIPSPTKDAMNIVSNNDGTIGEQLSMSNSQEQQFFLYKIENPSDLKDVIKSSSLGSSENNSKFPFFFVVPVNDDSNSEGNRRALAYEPGRLYLNRIGNYDNQKWDVSNLRNPKKSVLTHAVTNSGIGSLNNANQSGVNSEYYDPNNIKINFNLSDALKQQLLGIDTENGASASGSTKPRDNSKFYGQQCSTQLPKDAISGLCAGCDPNKL